MKSCIIWCKKKNSDFFWKKDFTVALTQNFPVWSIRESLSTQNFHVGSIRKSLSAQNFPIGSIRESLSTRNAQNFAHFSFRESFSTRKFLHLKYPVSDNIQVVSYRISSRSLSKHKKNQINKQRNTIWMTEHRTPTDQKRPSTPDNHHK